MQVLGTSAPIGYKEAGLIKGYDKFFPTFLAKDGIGWLIGFALLVYLAVMFPWEIGVKANPLSPAPVGIKPEWYFWAQFQLLKDFKFEGVSFWPSFFSPSVALSGCWSVPRSSGFAGEEKPHVHHLWSAGSGFPAHQHLQGL